MHTDNIFLKSQEVRYVWGVKTSVLFQWSPWLFAACTMLMIPVPSDHSFTLLFARPLNETIPQRPITAQAFFLYTQQAPPSSTQKLRSLSNGKLHTVYQLLNVPQAPQTLWPELSSLPCNHTGWDQKLNGHCFWHSVSKTWNLHSQYQSNCQILILSIKFSLLLFMLLLLLDVRPLNLTNSILHGWLYSPLHNS